MTKLDELRRYSDPEIVTERYRRYTGNPNAKVYVSDRLDKKYMIFDPITHQKIHFGAMGYEDFTKHKDEARRQRYLNRAMNIHGSWRHDKYSANNLAINLLW